MTDKASTNSTKPRVIGGKSLTHDWTPKREKHFAKTRVFGGRIDYIENPNGRLAEYYILECPKWVNIVATTPEGDMILIRQWRIATRSYTLEIPGGMVDPDEDPADAAVRELREETGFISDEAPKLIGVVDTNPALFDNQTYSYFIPNARREKDQELDAGEQIQIELFPAERIHELIDSGEIRHSLVLCALQFYARYLMRPA